MTDEEHNKILFEMILPALKGYISEKRQDGQSKCGDEKPDVGKFSFLLGHSVRHWIIPQENWHISSAAFKVWEIISNNVPMPHYRYKELFIPNKSIVIPRFKGNAKDFAKLGVLTITKGKHYFFNDIFIAEHTIPIADTIEALVECYNVHNNNPSVLENKMMDVLNSMHITQMLRIEDRRIVDCQKRIPQIIQNKGFNGNVYQYLIDSKNNIFEDVVEECYSNLMPKDVSISCSQKKYKKKLTSIKSNYGGVLPDWAKAIDLDDPKPYKIEITKKLAL